MVERSIIKEYRYRCEKKYDRMFQWLSRFKRTTCNNGYAKQWYVRKYIDGLKSSDMARRKEAAEHAVRWLIGY